MHYAAFDAPDLTPIIVCERTGDGWRGLTEDGELLNVQTHVNGTPVELPASIMVSANGEVLGYRKLPAEPSEGVIEHYTGRLAASSFLTRANEHERALEEIDLALSLAPTTLARFNRAMILLSLGRWQEGFEEWSRCERESQLFMRPAWRAAIEAGLEPWQGEDIAGKRLLLIHDHGFGDTIMMLRDVARLRTLGADVVLQMPPELHRLAAQCAPVTADLIDADYVCSILLLRQFLPGLLTPAPYLRVDPALVTKWKREIGDGKHIGVAWSVGKKFDWDYPRSVPLGILCNALGQEGELISVQQQGAAEADMLGVAHFQFEDFADCAALMFLMDEIVTVDTAAVHLAGAIGHPRVSLLLSQWSSWRWQMPLYRNVRICRQDSAGDWESALAKRDGAFAA